ncbi:putative nucleotidyltransferase [Acetobacter estunensis NRIC 0472]|uniref:Nucleotidyltransferase n=1 Tax=Acetobacter estunensis TaxID=104097 RepID=A0A967B4C7_9PROT|nr:nucleotidyltransferase domain-containing protein [Acetobacter estunensis]NHO52620.1 hypothetical protein [Acetobacter estunensis]GBQ22710.1 putative nucleotidyltransferase [Acetobacter estunensis NRIC 0472]
MNGNTKVTPVIRDIVERSLEEIEDSLEARIVLAFESGARGAGTPSQDSPWRIHFVFVHSLDWYLRLTPGADSVDLPVSDDFTLTGWDIGRLVRAMKNENPGATAWLRSAIAWRADEDLLSRLEALQRRSWQPGQEFRRQLDEGVSTVKGWPFGHTILLDQYFTALRATLSARWIADGRGPLPGDFQELCYDMDADLHEEIMKLVQKKAESPLSIPLPPSRHSEVFMEAEQKRLKDLVLPSGVATSAKPFDRLFADTVRRFG